MSEHPVLPHGSGQPPPSRSFLALHPGRLARAAYVFLNGFLTIGILAAVARVSGTPFIFPSLGPTAYLLFATPGAPPASPRNTVMGHALALLWGYAALAITGLGGEPPALIAGVTWDRVLAAALSLAGTGATMILAEVPHPPAGATTLIVSLGIVTSPFHLLILEVAVILLVLQALVMNRLEGTPYPSWNTKS